MDKESAASAKAKEMGRSPAPQVFHSDPKIDVRKMLQDRMDAENPAFTHVYVSKEIGEWEMESKQMEFARDEKGRILQDKGDPLVRIPRERYEAERKAEARRNIETVEAAASKAKRLTAFAKPKKPAEVDGDEPEEFDDGED